MSVMNEMPRLYVDSFVVVYLDGILVFKKTLEELLDHLDQVFESLCRDKLLVNLIFKEVYIRATRTYLSWILCELRWAWH
jgi:hypothetical protein